MTANGILASRQVIEPNGGVLEDKRRGKLRFWISTHQPQPDHPTAGHDRFCRHGAPSRDSDGRRHVASCWQIASLVDRVASDAAAFGQLRPGRPGTRPPLDGSLLTCPLMQQLQAVSLTRPTPDLGEQPSVRSAGLTSCVHSHLF
jgi:hypothetical protein